MNSRRIICWFSNGAASAVATKMSIGLFPDSEVIPVCCDTRPSEHADNYRFSEDCEHWFGRKIVFIKSQKYSTVDDVFERDKYMSGIKGQAKCTTELKKIPRLEFARPDDTHVFGMTFDERSRAREFTSRNPELILKWVLIEHAVTKRDCYDELRRAGIKLPVMYGLGFDNNNCPGCVKASSPWYWDKIRTHFPAVFQRRCVQSRAIGCRLVEIHHHERIFLDELPPGPFKKGGRENMSCGPECGVPMLPGFERKIIISGKEGVA
jgi:hypothetical protein